jgi:hypothetical protein
MADDQPSVDDAARLQARLRRLEDREDAQYAQGAIGQARDALSRASRATDDAGASSRAREIARAAVVLAERQLDRRKVQTELIETQRRLTANKERAKAQRRVLEALMKERATLARAQEPQ